MEKLKRLIIQLVIINNTIPFDKCNFLKTKRDINKIFFTKDSDIPILKLEGFCGLVRSSMTCYFISSIQLLFKIDTLVSLLNYLNIPENVSKLELNFNKQKYETYLENLKEWKIRENSLRLDIVNNNGDLDELYSDIINIKRDIDDLQSRVNIIFDTRCAETDTDYGKLILENFIKIYNEYKSNINGQISLNSIQHKGASIFTNLINIAFNLDIASSGRRLANIGDQNDTGEFIANLFRKLSCVDNEYVYNFIKSIQYNISSTFTCITTKVKSYPIINLDCLLQIKFESRMIKPGKLEYSFQELIDLYQSPENDILDGIQEVCNPMSKEDYIRKIKLLSELSKIPGAHQSLLRKPYNDELYLINNKYKNKANFKKLKINIPDELEYLIISITRQNAIGRIKPSDIALWNTPEWKKIPVIDGVKIKFHPYSITTNHFNIDDSKFLLKAVTIHSGGVTGGHYVCAICDDNGNPTTLIDDSSVIPAHSSAYISQIPTKGVTFLFRRLC